MLKKISRNQVRLGMYIQSLEGDWMSHPFWKTRFLLKDPTDLHALRNSGVDGVWIDTRKGADVATGDTPTSGTPKAEPLTRAPAPAPDARPAQSSAAEEMRRALRVLDRSRRAVIGLFSQARLGRAVDVDACLPVVEEISASVTRNASALISLARLKSRDEYTYMHSVSVCALMVALARQLEMDDSQTREAGLAGLLHDVGKMTMPEDVLNKPGKLTDEEFSVMRTHPERGHEILLRSGVDTQIALDVCLHHHERIDGRGYPHQLAGDEINVFARMGAICDVYDAVTSDRPYKQGWDAAESLVRMTSWEGHFDRTLFHAFVRAVGIYPLGTLVRLESDRLGVVVEQNGQDLTRPVVRIFFSARANAPIPTKTLNLADGRTGDRIVSRENPERWGFGSLDRLWR